MSAPIPTGYVMLRKIGRQVPEDFMGCKCPETRCKNANCPCSKGEYRCTSKCECKYCDNMYGIRGSEYKLPSTGITTQQAALSLATSVFRTGSTVPEDYNGCKCQTSRCYSGAGEKCPCVRDLYRCTSMCECIGLGCDNMIGLIERDSRTEPGQGGTGGVSNVPDETTPPPNIEPEQDDDTSTMTWEPPQMEEQLAQSRGFDLNELPPRDFDLNELPPSD